MDTHAEMKRAAAAEALFRVERRGAEWLVLAPDGRINRTFRAKRDAHVWAARVNRQVRWLIANPLPN